MSERVLIFGAAGLLGAELLTQLQDVLVYATFRTKREIKTENDFVFAISEEVDWSRHLEKILAQVKPTLVINALAQTNVDICSLEPRQALLVNTIFPKQLMQFLQPHQKLIQVSTDFVFSGQQNKLYQIKDAPRPINYYAYTKYLTEKFILETRHPNWVIVRTALVFGKDQQKTNYLFKFADCLRQKTPLKIVYDHRRTPTDVRDLALGIRLMMNQKKWRHRIYHLSGKEPIFFYDMIVKLAQTLNVTTENIQKVHSETLSTPAIRPPQTPLDIALSKEDLTYEPRSLEQSFKEYFLNE